MGVQLISVADCRKNIRLGVLVSYLTFPLVITGCAMVAFESAEVGALEVSAGGEAALAPSVTEGALESGAAEGGGILDLRSFDAPSEVIVADDGSGLARMVNGNQKFTVDWARGLVRNVKGDVLASIEDDRIYGNGPQGIRTPIAEILTETRIPSTLYSDATVKSTILKFLDSGESVRILTVSDGWYELRTDDGATGWIFAPLLRTKIKRSMDGRLPPTVYDTHPAQREILVTTLLTASRIRQDIRHFLASDQAP